MGRKKKHEEHENLERWLVSYADFITLLFATFVVLYALSQLDLAKFKLLKISLSEAFAPTLLQGKGSESAVMESKGETVLNESRQGDDVNILPPINPNLELKKMEQAKEEIQEKISKEKIEGVSAKVDSRGLVISLMDSVFFDSGSAALKAKAIKTLDKVAIMLKKDFPGNQIRVEGHTDSDPISSAIYPSNWELAGARASTIVRRFISSFKMNPQKFSAVGYADSVPLVPNSTRENKQKNRRVEIVVLNSTTAGQEAKSSVSSGTSSTSAPAKESKPDDNITVLKGDKETRATIEKELQEPEPTVAPSMEEAEPKGYKPIDETIKGTKAPAPPQIEEVTTKKF